MIYPIWHQIALCEWGEKEIPGPKDNKRITQYFSAVPLYRGPVKDETPHCSAFVNWVLGQCGIPGTNSALARSFQKGGLPKFGVPEWGKSCGPAHGAIVVFWRGKKSSIFGHVGFVHRILDGYVYTLGANQRDQVNISPYPLERVLGYRFPLRGN